MVKGPKISLFLKTLLLFVLLLAGVKGWGQTLLPNTSPVIQNFDGMGTTTTLPSNWRMHQTASPIWASGTSALGQQASSGSPTTGASYNWGSTAAERAAGVMSSSSYSSPSSLMGWYQNSNGSNITQLAVSYDCERYRINTAAASVQFYYSTDGSAWTSVSAGDIAAASLPTGANAYSFNPPQLTVNVASFNITGLNIPNGGNIYLRWNINTSGSNSQGIGIDNVSVTATFAAGCTPPHHPSHVI